MKKPYTQLENETMEALAGAPFSAREFRVMLAIIRLTNGFHLTETRVSLKYLIQLTGLARNHLQATVKRLSRWQVVVSDAEGLIACHGPALWRLPHSPKSGLSSRRTGTISHSPKSGLPHIVPDPDTKPASLKKTRKETSKEKVPPPTPPTPAGGASPPEASSEASPRLSQGKKKEGDPRVSEVFRGLEERLGYQVPNYGKEGAAIKRGLAMGFSKEEILGCWDKMKGFAFWVGKWLPLAKVVENLGEYRAGRLSDGKARRGYAETRVPQRYTPPEEY